jgi:hypothetical protein
MDLVPAVVNLDLPTSLGPCFLGATEVLTAPTCAGALPALIPKLFPAVGSDHRGAPDAGGWMARRGGREVAPGVAFSSPPTPAPEVLAGARRSAPGSRTILRAHKKNPQICEPKISSI